MECLNTDNAAKANLARKKRVGAKPSSLSTSEMKKPGSAAAVSATKEKQVPAGATAAAAAAKEAPDEEDSSEVEELQCLACGS